MRFVSPVLIALSVLAASPVHAQSRADSDPLLLGSPRPENEEAPLYPDENGFIHDPRDPAGWATFGGHAGFFSAIALTMTMMSLANDAETFQAVGMSILPTTIGLTAGGAFLFSKLAQGGQWDANTGWGAAGIFPGAMSGLALAGGLLQTADSDPGGGVRIAASIVGGLVGAYLGYRGFERIADRRGSASWETLAFWIGFFGAEIIGIAIASSLAGGAPDNANVALLLAGAGGVGGAIIGHELATW